MRQSRRGKPVVQNRNGPMGSASVPELIGLPVRSLGFLIRISAAVSWLVAAPGILPAAPVVPWQAGDRFFVAESIVQDMQLRELRDDAANDPQIDERRLARTTWTEYRVLAAEESGAVRIAATILSIRDANDQPLPLSSRLNKVRLEFRIDRDRRISEITGYEEFIQQIASGNRYHARLLKSICSQQALRQSFSLFFQNWPPADDETKDWRSEAVIPAGPLGTFTINWQYQFESDADDAGIRRFRGRGTARYETSTSNPSDQPVKVNSGRLQLDNLVATGQMDSRTGRLRELKTELTASGRLTLRVGRQNTTVEVTQKQSTQIRVLDKMPALP